ncbi:MAG: hypothetical protein KIT52_17425 [Anaerolineae bacterium]|nr:hypothetical protein [Anaerolineae bacterium]
MADEPLPVTLPRAEAAGPIARADWRARARTLAVGAAVFLAAVALFGLVQTATPGIIGNDGYYHIKMAYLIRQEGLTPAFEALPYTILNADAYYDHHLLFHLLLTPFAAIDPAVDGGAALTQGAKLATVLLPALGVVMAWWLLRGQGVPYAAGWALALFAVSEAFLFRMSMARAQSGAVVLLLLALHWLLTGRHRWLAPLGFVFVWFYNAFPLLLVVAGVYVVAVALLERRVVWAALLFPAAGIVLGLLVNPYFPRDIVFLVGHLLPKVGTSAVPVGNEWSPYETWTIVQNSGGALAAVLLGALALGWREERIDRATLVGLGLVGVFGLMFFRSRRFVEYFPVFAVLFLAFASAPLVQGWKAQRAHTQVRPYVGAAAVVLAVLIALTVRDARALISTNKPADYYAAAMLYLRGVAPDGVTIFQTDWDDFTRQFFYFDDARYINGLDPTFMQQYDEGLYSEWVAITRGDRDAPGETIRDRFGAQYVFSDLNHKRFLARAANDPLLREIYRDDYAVIFAVRP